MKRRFAKAWRRHRGPACRRGEQDAARQQCEQHGAHGGRRTEEGAGHGHQLHVAGAAGAQQVQWQQQEAGGQ
jgi:hypothetical protein